MELMQNLWMPEDKMLLYQLKEGIMEGTMFEIPDPYQRFYIKTDWNKEGIEAVLLQSYYLE